MTTSVATLLEDALRHIAGADVAPASMTIDYGSAAAPATTKAWIERSTRSLLFVQAQAQAEDGTPVAIASAVFRRVVAV